MRVLGPILPEQVLVHGNDGRLRPLASEEQGLEAPQPAALSDAGKSGVVRVLLANGAQGSWCCEHGVDLVLVDQAPEGGCVGRADGLAFVEDGGGAGEEGPIQRVAVGDDPADVAEAAHLVLSGVRAYRWALEDGLPHRLARGCQRGTRWTGADRRRARLPLVEPPSASLLCRWCR